MNLKNLSCEFWIEFAGTQTNFFVAHLNSKGEDYLQIQIIIYHFWLWLIEDHFRMQLTLSLTHTLCFVFDQFLFQFYFLYYYFFFTHPFLWIAFFYRYRNFHNSIFFVLEDAFFPALSKCHRPKHVQDCLYFVQYC